MWLQKDDCCIPAGRTLKISGFHKSCREGTVQEFCWDAVMVCKEKSIPGAFRSVRMCYLSIWFWSISRFWNDVAWVGYLHEQDDNWNNWMSKEMVSGVWIHSNPILPLILLVGHSFWRMGIVVVWFSDSCSWLFMYVWVMDTLIMAMIGSLYGLMVMLASTVKVQQDLCNRKHILDSCRCLEWLSLLMPLSFSCLFTWLVDSFTCR